MEKKKKEESFVDKIINNGINIPMDAAEKLAKKVVK